MIVSVSLFPLSDACLKYLLHTYSVEQTAFLRALIRFLFLCLPSFFYKAPWKSFYSTKRPILHAGRIIASIVSTYCFMAACRKGSLTLIYTLGYTTPFFVVLLSALFFKERVSVLQWIVVFIGMVGVSVALQSTLFLQGALLEPVLLVLLGTFCAAVNKLSMRKLAETEESLTIALYPNIATILLFLPFLMTSWQSMPFMDWALFGAVGLALGVAQFLIAFSLRCASPSLLAPIDYTSFVWVVLIDTCIWERIPDAWTAVGASIIIVSNLVLFSRSQQCQKKSIPL